MGTRDHPIIFSGPMVRAILDGRKTQTRRPMPWPGPVSRYSRILPGHRLWVREGFHTAACWDSASPLQVGGMAAMSGADLSDVPIWYRADGAYRGPSAISRSLHVRWGGPGKGRPSIHMPRWASRIDLEVTKVVIHGIREIREEDAEAEGVERDPVDGSYLSGFRTAWDAIYNRDGYRSTDHLWVYAFSFRRVAAEAHR